MCGVKLKAHMENRNYYRSHKGKLWRFQGNVFVQYFLIEFFFFFFNILSLVTYKLLIDRG